VRLHGGSVEAANHPDGGLIVSMILPEQTANSKQQTAEQPMGGVD
jgi:signal transduction histidine kinase